MERYSTKLIIKFKKKDWLNFLIVDGNDSLIQEEPNKCLNI